MGAANTRVKITVNIASLSAFGAALAFASMVPAYKLRLVREWSMGGLCHGKRKSNVDTVVPTAQVTDRADDRLAGAS